MEISKLQQLNKEYEGLKAKGVKLNNITLEIHMPTGEIESIVNPNVEEKIKYINKTYSEDLIHANCSNIYITNYIFVEDEITYDFGFALAYLKDGHKIARKGWNGKGMYVYYVPAASYKACTENARKEFGEMVPYEPYLAIKNVKGTISTWVPSINDCLAEDWEVIK